MERSTGSQPWRFVAAGNQISQFGTQLMSKLIKHIKGIQLMSKLIKHIKGIQLMSKLIKHMKGNQLMSKLIKHMKGIQLMSKLIKHMKGIQLMSKLINHIKGIQLMSKLIKHIKDIQLMSKQIKHIKGIQLMSKLIKHMKGIQLMSKLLKRYETYGTSDWFQLCDCCTHKNLRPFKLLWCSASRSRDARVVQQKWLFSKPQSGVEMWEISPKICLYNQNSGLTACFADCLAFQVCIQLDIIIVL